MTKPASPHPFEDIFNFDANPVEDVINLLFGGGNKPHYEATREEFEEFVEYKFPLPGVSQNNTIVNITNNVLSIREVVDGGTSYNAVYTVKLAPIFDVQNAVAASKDGIVTVQLPFSESRNGVDVQFGSLRPTE